MFATSPSKMQFVIFCWGGWIHHAQRHPNHHTTQRNHMNFKSPSPNIFNPLDSHDFHRFSYIFMTSGRTRGHLGQGARPASGPTPGTPRPAPAWTASTASVAEHRRWTRRRRHSSARGQVAEECPRLALDSLKGWYGLFMDFMVVLLLTKELQAKSSHAASSTSTLIWVECWIIFLV